MRPAASSPPSKPGAYDLALHGEIGRQVVEVALLLHALADAPALRRADEPVEVPEAAVEDVRLAVRLRHHHRVVADRAPGRLVPAQIDHAVGDHVLEAREL